MTAPKLTAKTDEPLPAHTRKVGPPILFALVVLALIGLVTPILVATYGNGDVNARESNNAAAQANQRTQRCATLQGIRWRQASTKLQIAFDDLAEASTPTAVRQAHADGRTARRLLAAVNVDDERLKQGTLCPYVPGEPARTPDEPVNPTPPSTEPR